MMLSFVCALALAAGSSGMQPTPPPPSPPGLLPPPSPQRQAPPPVAGVARVQAMVLEDETAPVTVPEPSEQAMRYYRSGNVLWLVEQEGVAEGNLRGFLAARGIDPARLVFAPRVGSSEHIARLRTADIAVDTFPCVSHTTANDLAWAGVPLVTVTGSTFASRVAGSVLAALGGDEHVFASHEGAFAATVALARDAQARNAARERLEAMRQSPFFDSARFARDFEALIARRIAEG
jgi:hypothetical protein